MKPSWQDLQLLNLYPKMKDALSNYHIDTKTELLTKTHSLSWNLPWDHINNDPERIDVCGRMHMLFNCLGFIPSFCLGCWKVVVSPNSLRQLFQLRDLMREMAKENPKCWCKCGVEMRPFNGGRLYGGYYYANSYEEGLERWKEVRILVDHNIGEDVNVILKRFCSEFELKFGDPDEYELSESSKVQEKMFLSMMDMDIPARKQPRFALLQVYQNWISYGWKYGSSEDRKEIEEDHNDGKPLYKSPKTYHPKHEVGMWEQTR